VPSSRARIIITTVAAEQEARSLARRLVDDRIAACVNIVGPIRSIYRWRDAIEDEAEFLLLIKTTSNRLKEAERRVSELHSYEVPELLVISPERGSASYLAWLRDATSSSPMRAASPAVRGRRKIKSRRS
jgi:periplasmic divalent cation tolerance protein